MAAGDDFDAAQREVLRQTVADIAAVSELDVALYVGPLAQGRTSARALHAARPDPDRALLIAVDPAGRAVEIVTGSLAAERCDERTCALATAAMTSSFAAGDLFGGLRNGLLLLASHARSPRLLHLGTI